MLGRLEDLSCIFYPDKIVARRMHDEKVTLEMRNALCLRLLGKIVD